MALQYQKNGNLIKGVHILTWEEFVNEFGYNEHRVNLIKGLEKAIFDLKSCDCKTIYIDGSFTTLNPLPKDFDACYETSGMNLVLLKLSHPVFFDHFNHRLQQKLKYNGELVPASALATPFKKYIDFFQRDRDNKPKGIVQINL